MAYDALGDFLEALLDAGELVRITAPVDSAVELAAIVDQVVQQQPEGAPALLFSSVRNSQVPVVANLLGHPRRLCRALGVESLPAAAERFSTSLQNVRPGSWWEALKPWSAWTERSGWSPQTVKHGLSQQVVKLGRDINLYEWPLPRHWPQETLPVLTAGLLVTPSTSAQPWRLSRIPLQVVDRQRLLPYWLPSHPVWTLLEQYRREQRQLPVAVVFGGDPVLQIAAEALDWPGLPTGFAWPGLLRGKSVELVKCRTHELEVPADAEWIIEGFVDPTAPWEPVVGLALSTGYVAERTEVPPLQVTAMTHRASPIVPTMVPGRPPHESAWLCQAIDHLLLPLVQQVVPDIVDFSRPWSGGTRQTVFVSLRKSQPFQARQVMHALWGFPPFRRVKTLVVVDADVDVHQETAVWSAVSSHVDPTRDVICLTGAADMDDHAMAVRGVGGRWGIDATRKGLAEGAGRPWPEELRWPPELLHHIRERWAEFGLAAMLAPLSGSPRNPPL